MEHKCKKNAFYYVEDTFTFKILPVSQLSGGFLHDMHGMSNTSCGYQHQNMVLSYPAELLEDYILHHHLLHHLTDDKGRPLNQFNKKQVYYFFDKKKIKKKKILYCN